MITIKAFIHAPKELIWDCWTNPIHVTKWNHATDDWHTPHASSDLTVGGKFLYRMEAKDGSFGFDFCGTFTHLEPPTKLSLALGDNRKVDVEFVDADGGVEVIESFEPEQENPVEMQQMGWQMILDNFKQYAEQHHANNKN